MDGDELDVYLAKYRAEVRRETLEEAARSVCVYCREGERHSFNVCTAYGIRCLLTTEQDQGEEKD
jgi:tRNA(Ile)-lysidine synthase TilS/MesJ